MLRFLIFVRAGHDKLPAQKMSVIFEGKVIGMKSVGKNNLKRYRFPREDTKILENHPRAIR